MPTIEKKKKQIQKIINALSKLYPYSIIMSPLSNCTKIANKMILQIEQSGLSEEEIKNQIDIITIGIYMTYAIMSKSVNDSNSLQNCFESLEEKLNLSDTAKILRENNDSESLQILYILSAGTAFINDEFAYHEKHDYGIEFESWLGHTLHDEIEEDSLRGKEFSKVSSILSMHFLELSLLNGKFEGYLNHIESYRSNLSYLLKQQLKLIELDEISKCKIASKCVFYEAIEAIAKSDKFPQKEKLIAEMNSFMLGCITYFPHEDRIKAANALIKLSNKIKDKSLIKDDIYEFQHKTQSFIIVVDFVKSICSLLTIMLIGSGVGFAIGGIYGAAIGATALGLTAFGFFEVGRYVLKQNSVVTQIQNISKPLADQKDNIPEDETIESSGATMPFSLA
jgi:hypothetical protein